MLASSIPLSLYIHIPWCVKKCPYCDFNSHGLKENQNLPEKAYITALETDLINDIIRFKTQNRPIQSIFIGGGTPSLFSANSIEELLNSIKRHCILAPDIEITLEANPGTIEHGSFEGFLQAGINRLSLGIQSFQSEKLKSLGRIHSEQEAIFAVQSAQKAGFKNINLDLMYGLPNQSLPDALFDLQLATSLNPTHLSWYQLTLEPNTAFYHKPPQLPVEDRVIEIQEAGQSYLAEQKFFPYEISAYTHTYPSKHNLNYWLFGDYLAIGAGAHGKITNPIKNTITRYWKTRHPKDYLNLQTPFLAGEKIISIEEMPLEFMMNALRLYQKIPISLFTERTGLKIHAIEKQLNQAKEAGLLSWEKEYIETTRFGKTHLNNLLEIFL